MATFDTYTKLDNVLLAPFQAVAVSAADNMAAVVAPVFTAGATLYMMWWGWAVMRGEVQEALSQGIVRLIKIYIVSFFALNAGNYQSWVVDIFSSDLPKVLSSVYVTADSQFGLVPTASVFDRLTRDVATFNAKVMEGFSYLDPVAGFHKVMQVWVLGTIAYVVITMFYAAVVFAKMGLQLVLSLGPLFICLGLFDSTRGYAQAFVNTLLALVLKQVILLALAAICVKSMQGAVAVSSVATAAESSAQIISTFLFAALFIFEVPALASSLAMGGFAMQMQQPVSMSRAVGGAGGKAGRAAWNKWGAPALSSIGRGMQPGPARVGGAGSGGGAGGGTGAGRVRAGSVAGGTGAVAGNFARVEPSWSGVAAAVGGAIVAGGIGGSAASVASNWDRAGEEQSSASVRGDAAAEGAARSWESSSGTGPAAIGGVQAQSSFEGAGVSGPPPIPGGYATAEASGGPASVGGTASAHHGEPGGLAEVLGTSEAADAARGGWSAVGHGGDDDYAAGPASIGGSAAAIALEGSEWISEAGGPSGAARTAEAGERQVVATTVESKASGPAMVGGGGAATSAAASDDGYLALMAGKHGGGPAHGSEEEGTG